MTKITGIIYKTQEYKETSKLLFVYTNKGKVTLNARGSQRINSNDRILSQYLNLIEFEYSVFKDFMNLYNGKLINDYKEIKNEYNNVKSVSLMLELIDKIIIDNDNNEQIYNMLISALNSKNYKYVSLSFSLKLLYYLGYGLNLKPDNKNVTGISIVKGGLVYEGENYYNDLDIKNSIDLLKLTHYKFNDLNKLNNIDIKEIESFIYKYYLDKMGLILKTLK